MPRELNWQLSLVSRTIQVIFSSVCIFLDSCGVVVNALYHINLTARLESRTQGNVNYWGIVDALCTPNSDVIIDEVANRCCDHSRCPIERSRTINLLVFSYALFVACDDFLVSLVLLPCFLHCYFLPIKAFDVDFAENYQQRQHLASYLLAEDPKRGQIQFVIVSEPSTPTQSSECEEIGVARVNVRHILLKGSEPVNEPIPSKRFDMCSLPSSPF